MALSEVPDEQLVGEDPRVRGAMVTGVTAPTSPAAVAGLQMGDLILTVGDNEITDIGHLMRIIGDSMSGSIVRLGVVRGDEALEIKVTLGSRPTTLAAR